MISCAFNHYDECSLNKQKFMTKGIAELGNWAPIKTSHEIWKRQQTSIHFFFFSKFQLPESFYCIRSTFVYLLRILSYQQICFKYQLNPQNTKLFMKSGNEQETLQVIIIKIKVIHATTPCDKFNYS